MESISYYLACFETGRFVWVGTSKGEPTEPPPDAELVSSFCLVHRGKALIVVSEEHDAIQLGEEWCF